MKNIHIVLKKCEFLSNEISIFMRELLTTQGDGGHMILRTQFFEAPIIYISFDQYTIFMLLPLIHWENNFYLLVHLILKSMSFLNVLYISSFRKKIFTQPCLI